MPSTVPVKEFSGIDGEFFVKDRPLPVDVMSRDTGAVLQPVIRIVKSFWTLDQRDKNMGENKLRVFKSFSTFVRSDKKFWKKLRLLPAVNTLGTQACDRAVLSFWSCSTHALTTFLGQGQISGRLLVNGFLYLDSERQLSEEIWRLSHPVIAPYGM